MPVQTKTCPACGLVVDSSESSCPRDGTVLESPVEPAVAGRMQQASNYKTCPACGLQLKPSTKVCPRDGTNLLYAGARPPLPGRQQSVDVAAGAARSSSHARTLHDVPPAAKRTVDATSAATAGQAYPGANQAPPGSRALDASASLDSPGMVGAQRANPLASGPGQAGANSAPASGPVQAMSKPDSALPNITAPAVLASPSSAPSRICPLCRFQCDDSAAYCPMDGTKLVAIDSALLGPDIVSPGHHSTNKTLLLPGGGSAARGKQPAQSTFTFGGMTQGVGGLGTGGLMTKSCPKCGFQVESTVEQCPRDGTDLNPIVTDPIFVQKFRYLGKIGSGGMGVIYKAKHLILDKTVAIKMIHGHMSSAEALQRFLIEGRATSLLSHPNIVAVHDLGTTTAGHPYMVMDYVEGKTLADVFANEPPLTIDRFLNIFIKVCDALSHAHGKSILHRDLKPSNIMLVRDDDGLETVKIMDFGIAKLLDDTDSGAQRLTKTGDAIGSPVYMSPEQAQGVRLDGRCDLYSLGCVMFEALAGVPPFTGATPLETLMMHIQDQPPTIEQASLGKKTDPRLESIVIKLLQKDPDVRYASMDDLKQDLVNYHELIPSATKLKPDATLARPQTGSQMHSWRVPLIATGVLVIGLVLSGVFFTTPFLKRPQSNNQPTVEKTQKPPVFVNAAGPKEDSPEENSKTSAPDHSKADLMSDDVGALIQQRALRGDQKIELNAIGFVKPLKDSDLEPLKDADQLRELAIANSEITDKGLECLKKVPLTSLNISNTKVRDLSPLAHQLQLDSLNASKDEISDNGFQVIAGLKSLRLLKINHTRLDDAQLKKLSSLKNLRELEISPCPHVTTAGVAEFKKLLPKCKVAYSQNQDIYQTKGWADLDKAQSAERRSDWLEAERSYKDCMESEEERFEESQKIDYDLAVRSAVGMAQCEEKLGDYLHAVKICQDTLNHLKRRKAPAFALAQLIFQKASAEEKAGRRDSSLRSRLEADKYFGEALEKTTDPGTRRLAAENKLQEAIDYSEAERPAAGADALTQASALCKPLTETIESYPTAFEKVAGAFAMQNRQDKALYLFGEAEKYYKAHPKLNPGTNRLDLKRALGDSYYAQKKYAEAIPYLKEVVDSSAIPLTVRKSRCAFLVDALNKNHNMGEAARYSKKFR